MIGKETFFLVLSITQWPLILIGAKNNCVYFRFPIILTSVQWKEEQSLFDTIHLFAALEMTWHDKNQKKEAKENHPPHQTLHMYQRQAIDVRWCEKELSLTPLFCNVYSRNTRKHRMMYLQVILNGIKAFWSGFTNYFCKDLNLAFIKELAFATVPDFLQAKVAFGFL